MVSSDERRENGKERKESREIILATWGDRFLAWLIDFILVSIGLAVLFGAIAIPIWFFYYNDDMTALEHTKMSNLHTTLYQALLFFGYWTYFEYSSGQSIGKRLLKIKTVDLSGNRIDIKSLLLKALVRPSCFQ